MRLPQSVAEKATKASKKKPLEAVSIFRDAGNALEEFDVTDFGNKIQAYVKVSLGDTITLSFEIPCTEPQIVDVFIDGVLRESNIAINGPVNAHRGKIAEVCACEIRSSGAKGKLEYCQMRIEDRKTSKDDDSQIDVRSSAPGFHDLHASAVGTIEIRVLREIKSSTKAHLDIKPEQAERGPTFEDNLRWWDVSRRVDPGIISPTYQIGFFNGRKTHGSSRKNINRSIEGYYLWASFKFLYRSGSDIHATGLDNNNDLSKPSSNIRVDRSTTSTGKMENTQLAATAAVDKKSILSLKAVSGISVNQLGSSSASLQQPETELVNGSHDNENVGYLEQAKEDLQVVTPAKLAVTPSSIQVVVAGGGQKTSEILGSQRSPHAYCETERSDEEIDKRQELSFKGLSKIANQKKAKHELSTNQEASKRAPISGSRSAIAFQDQAVANYPEEAVALDANVEDTVPILSQAKDVQDDTANENSLDYYSGSRRLSDKQEWDRRIKRLAEAFPLETDSKGVTNLPVSTQIKPTTGEEATLRKPESENSLDISSPSPSPSSFSHVGSDGDAAQEPRIDPELELQKNTNVHRTAPNTMMRAKAGHYVSRSPLVDLDTKDLEEQAKAMTNGKGDWPSRLTHLVHKLSAPSKNRALSEDTPSMAVSKPTTNTLATGLLPSYVSDTLKKRKFDEFGVDADSTLRPSSSIPNFLSSQNALRMSLKARREELARKKRVKREILEKAKAEADALRRQVEDFEAKQDEALAQEEAELERLDMEIENIQGEAQALAARLLALHEE